MVVEISLQNVILLSTATAAFGVLTGYLVKGVRWFDRQGQQDKEIDAIKAQHDEDMAAIRHEQTVIVYGLLACLRGLKEQGCNGPVADAIKKIEKYLNQKAHDEEVF